MLMTPWLTPHFLYSTPRSLSLHAEIVEVEREVVSPSIVPSGNFLELNHTVACMVLKANDRRTSCPCHDEFYGPRSDYVRQVALENNNNNFVHLDNMLMQYLIDDEVSVSPFLMELLS
ncbi:hypothetical protein TNCV_3197721 [Trichonephila clavipes]|nr:hypothetical protein TNCV_3197721 [Trichonephila clavipes]